MLIQTQMRIKGYLYCLSSSHYYWGGFGVGCFGTEEFSDRCDMQLVYHSAMTIVMLACIYHLPGIVLVLGYDSRFVCDMALVHLRY